MRKKSLIFVVLLAFVCMVPQRAFANMAAPEDADVGSAITFEKNDEILQSLDKLLKQKSDFSFLSDTKTSEIVQTLKAKFR